MDPRNHFNVMHLQDPIPAALDLSMGCRKLPIKPTSVEALDLVKKASRSDHNSGTNSRITGVPECQVSKSFKQGTPDCSELDTTARFEYESIYHTMPLHNSTLPLFNGLPSIAQVVCPCPPISPELEDDDDGDDDDDDDDDDGTSDADTAFMDPSGSPLERLMATSQNAKTETGTAMQTRRTTREKKITPSRLDSQSQCTKAGSSGKNTTDVRLPRTRSKGFLVPQGSASPTPSLHSTSSVSIISEDSELVERHLFVHKQTAVETLSSECNFSDENSLCSVEYISSDYIDNSDSSDVIEVPVSSSTCNDPSSNHLLIGSIINQKRPTRSSPRLQLNLGYGMDCKRVKNACHTNELSYHNIADTLESSGVSSPTVMQDSDPETNALVPRNFPSTSDIKNADIHKAPQKKEPSLSSCKRDPPSKRKAPPKRNQLTSTKPKKKSPSKKRTKPTPQSKRKKLQPSRSSTSMFATEEPEIKLKFANYKEEKRESKGENFAPYIHMEFSACTVVNFQDDENDIKAKKRPQSSVSSVASGIVPTTSCLLLGRLSSDARSRVGQLCSLCGRVGNVNGLGDLHGPYCGPQSDTSCGPVVASHVSELPRGPAGRVPDGVLDSGENCSGPAELLRESCLLDERPGVFEYVSDCREHWVHEDCSIWSVGVFLIKGKLYGLEEAVRLAQEAVCSCCDRAGATLGCFFKGCPSKYHFPCAVQADCSFNEENFTIKCPTHKNKSPRTSFGRRQNR